MSRKTPSKTDALASAMTDAAFLQAMGLEPDEILDEIRAVLFERGCTQELIEVVVSEIKKLPL